MVFLYAMCRMYPLDAMAAMPHAWHFLGISVKGTLGLIYIYRISYIYIYIYTYIYIYIFTILFLFFGRAGPSWLLGLFSS